MRKQKGQSVDERIAEYFANVFLSGVPDEITIDETDYESATLASREILMLISGTFWFTWMANAVVSYELTPTVYGIAVSASATILLIGADVKEAIHDHDATTVAGDNIKSPVVYNVVMRFGGFLFFSVGFLLQLLAMYYSSVNPGTIIPYLTDNLDWYRAEGVYNFLLVVVSSLGAYNVITTRRIVIEVTKVVAIVFSIVAVGGLIQIFFGPAWSSVAMMILILCVQIIYLGIILKDVGKGVAATIRVARRLPDEVIDEKPLQDTNENKSAEQNSTNSDDDLNGTEQKEDKETTQNTDE